MDNVTFTPPAIANLKDMLNKSAMLYGEKDAYQIKNSDGTFTHYTYIQQSCHNLLPLDHEL